MAESKSKIEEVSGASSVTVTTETPAKADETSNPIPNDAEANQPPVRTNRPDVPIAQVLAAGAGAHEGRELDHEVDGVAVDSDGIDADGRFVGTPKKGK
jgi:hypothetical protein